MHVKPISIVGGRYYDKVEVMISGDTAPDLMWMGQGFATFAARGAFLCVQDLYDDIDLDKYISEVLDWYRIDGKLYGFPTGVGIGCIIYSQDLFDEAGVPHPDNDWTADAFVDAAKKLTRTSTVTDALTSGALWALFRKVFSGPGCSARTTHDACWTVPSRFAPYIQHRSLQETQGLATFGT